MRLIGRRPYRPGDPQVPPLSRPSFHDVSVPATPNARLAQHRNVSLVLLILASARLSFCQVILPIFRVLTSEDRSRRSSNQPLSLSMASNSLLFTAQARRQTAPPPEPIGKRSTVRDRSSPSASELLMTRKASKEWSPYYEYDIAGVKRPRSRPPSIRSSHKSSLCSGKSRSTVQRKQSIETVRSKVSVTSGVSASRLNGRFIRLTLDEPASLTNIPTELVHAICRYLPRDDLCNFICVCKRIHTDVTVLLYATPQFVSTYRLAQFVTIISHNQRLAELVRELNLSGISKLPTDFGLAGWREWKYRSEKLYSVYPEGNTVGLNFKHPLAHPLLLKHSTGGPDVPLGLLMHIVKACTHLRYLPCSDIEMKHIR